MSTERRKGTLSVNGPYEITFLRVLDPSLREVASGTGQLEVDLDPGIYRLQAQIPGDRAEKLIEIKPGDQVLVNDFKLQFDSSAPVDTALSTHEYHQDPARSTSATLHATIGGSTAAKMFIFARTKGEPSSTLVEFTVRGSTGEATFPEVGKENPQAGWLAMSLGMPAGTYTIEKNVPGLGRRGQALFVEGGWMSQVFVPWGETVDLSQATIFMRRLPANFDPSQPWEYEPVEAALNGLARGRLVLSQFTMQDFLEGKFDNPMLGLIGAYALLVQGKVDYERLQRIANNLVQLLPHSPDAALISLLADLQGNPLTAYGAPSGVPTFREPPLFAIGTEYLMHLAAEYEDLVPIDSLLARISPALTTGSAWTRWDTEASWPESLAKLSSTISRTRMLASESRSTGWWFFRSRSEQLSTEQIARQLQLPLSVVNAAESGVF